MAAARTLNPQPVITSPHTVDSAPDSVSIGFGANILAIYVFLLISRMTEYSFLNGLRLMLLMAAAMGILAIVNGGLFRAVASKPGIWLTVCTGWMLLATPFSVWVGGSVNGIVNMWLKSYMTFFLVGGLITNARQCRRLVFALAAGTAVMMAITNLMAVTATDQRVSMDSGTLGNANDLAAALLMGMPFTIHVAADKARNKIIRVAFALVSLGILATVPKTGSRGALLCIVLLIPIVFFKSSAANKIKIIALTLTFAIALPFIVSKEVKARLMTLVTGGGDIAALADSIDPDDNVAMTVRSAAESSESRRQLFQHAMEIALHNPVFGIGFGQFAVADANRAEKAGEEANWHEVHNVFAMILVENGLPTLIFFVLALFHSFITALRIYNKTRLRPDQKDISGIALALTMSLVIYFICDNFAPNAYGYQFPALAGFVAGLEVVARAREKQAVVAMAAPDTAFLDAALPARRLRPAAAAAARKPRSAEPSWRF